MKRFFTALAFTILLGCSGSQNNGPADQPSVQVKVADKLLQQSWNIRLADDSARTSFEQSPGWIHYYKHEYEEALNKLEGVAAARLHAEYAVLYRQALLLHSHATEHSYGELRQKEDSAETLYLRGVARVFLNKLGDAQKDLQPFTNSSNEDLKKHASQWLSWLNGKRAFPPTLQGFFFEPPNKATVRVPPPQDASQYFFPSPLPGNPDIEASEGTALWLRSQWHEQQARSLLGETAGIVDAWLAPWRLPFEPKAKVNASLKITDEWLFMGFYLMPDDVHFVHEIQEKGLAAVEVWQERSLLASLLKQTVKDGKVDTDKVVDVAADLEIQTLKEVKKRTQKTNLYPVLPAFSKFAVLRAGMFLADANDQYRDAGKLRLNVREATGAARDPLFLISLAAWDTGNKASMRAQDIVHEYRGSFPALMSARVPLDSLHIRLGRNSTSGGPAH